MGNTQSAASNKPTEKKSTATVGEYKMTTSQLVRELSFCSYSRSKATLEISDPNSDALLLNEMVLHETNFATYTVQSTISVENTVQAAETKARGIAAPSTLPATNIKNYGTIEILNESKYNGKCHSKAGIQLMDVRATREDMAIVTEFLEHYSLYLILASSSTNLDRVESLLSKYLIALGNHLEKGVRSEGVIQSTTKVSVSGIKIKTFFNNSQIELTKKTNEPAVHIVVHDKPKPSTRLA